MDTLKVEVEEIELNVDIEIDTFIANDKYLSIGQYYNKIDIFSMNSFKRLGNIKIDNKINHLEFHPKFCNILSVSFINLKVCIFNINSKNEIQLKTEYLSNAKIIIFKTLFNPTYNPSLLAILYDNNIKIWDINSYDCINNININNKKILQTN